MQTETAAEPRKGHDPFPSSGVMDALFDMQTPGMSMSFLGPDGEKGATIEDPHVLLAELCEKVKETDPATEPWPEEDGKPVEFVQTDLVKEIGDALIEGIYRLAPLAQFRIHYVFRNVDNWKQNGRNVLGQMKKPSGLLKRYARADYIVLLHWPSWQAMNPMQRVALVYHELRHGDAEGKVRGHDFEGFFDELKLFGTDTYRDWQSLAEAADRGARVQHQFSFELEL